MKNRIFDSQQPYDTKMLFSDRQSSSSNDSISKVSSEGIAWEQVGRMPVIRLYAGDIPERKEYEGLIGLSLTRNDDNHLRHDITQPFPLADNLVDSFQAEDVFEHIQYEKLALVVNEIYRVLKQGGLFRLSVPDYGCDVLQNRSIRDENGRIVFDPGGDGTPESPGHVWFPRIDTVMQLLTKTKFHTSGKIELLHYYNKDGTFVVNPINYSKGHVMRTPDFDERVQNPYRPMSLVIDLTKGRAIASQSCRTKPEIWSGSVLANEINSSPAWCPEKQNQYIQRRFTENSLASFAEELVKKAVQLLKDGQESDAMDYFDVGARLQPQLTQKKCKQAVETLDENTLNRICSKARRKTATVQKHQGASLLLKNTQNRLDKMQEALNGCVENRQSKTQNQYTANKYTCENPKRNESRTKKYLPEIFRHNGGNMFSKMQVLGTKYGGWAVDLDMIPFGSTVISAGVGEDISFDLELINRKNCKIIGTDPTEKAKRYIERNKNERFCFIQKALYSESNKKIRIYKNKNPNYVSESITKSHNMVLQSESYEAETISIEDLLNHYKNVSVLKIDIEGAEYDVLNSVSKLDIPQICVEFHHFCTNFTANDTEKCIERLMGMGYLLAHCTSECGAIKEATFLHRKYINNRDITQLNVSDSKALTATLDTSLIGLFAEEPQEIIEAKELIKSYYKKRLKNIWFQPNHPVWFDHEIDYHLWPDHIFWIERGVFGRIVMKPGCHVLDLCCGDGYYSDIWYSTIAGSIDACDNDRDALRFASYKHSNPKVKYYCIDILQEPFPSPKYDVVTWFGAIEHFNEEQIIFLLTKIKASINEGGILVGSTPLVAERAIAEKKRTNRQHEREFVSTDDLEGVIRKVFTKVQSFVSIHIDRTICNFRAVNAI